MFLLSLYSRFFFLSYYIIVSFFFFLSLEPSPPVKTASKEQEEEVLIGSPLSQDEFVSDAFGDSNINEEDIRKEMEQQLRVAGGEKEGKIVLMLAWIFLLISDCLYAEIFVYPDVFLNMHVLV